jgi:hypothetical protein
LGLIRLDQGLSGGRSLNDPIGVVLQDLARIVRMNCDLTFILKWSKFRLQRLKLDLTLALLGVSRRLLTLNAFSTPDSEDLVV